MLGAEPGIVEIDSFRIYFFNHRVVGLFVHWDPVGNQQPMGFDFAFNFSQAGISFFLEFDPMFFEDPFEAAVGGTGFSGLGILYDFMKGLLFSEGM